MLLEKGQRWLDDDDDVMTFVQMNQFLVNENSRCLQTCLDMANGKEEVCLCDEDASLGKKTSKLIPTSNDKEERSEPQRNKEEINGDRSIPPSSIQTETNFSTLNDKIETVTKSLTKKIKSLQKRNTEQEKFIQEMLKNQTIAENKTKAKLDDFLTELHKANEYIKFQTEFLSQKVENCKDSNETIRNQQEQIENNYKENIENITKQLQSCHELIKVETESLDKLRKELQATKDCNDLIKSENHIFLTKLSHVENTLHDVSKDLEKLKKDFTDISISVSQTESSNKLNLEHFRNTFTDIDDRMISFSSDLDKMTGDIVTIKSKNIAESFYIGLYESVETDVYSEEVVKIFDCPYNADETHPLPYDTQTGVYTAPYGGLYLICLMIENLTDLRVQLGVFTKYDNDEECLQGICRASLKDTTTSTVFPITLRKDEQVYSKYADDYECLRLGYNSTFVCLLIKKI